MSRPIHAGPRRVPFRQMYEFRSDTFTRPTKAMRRAMSEAEVGDDVWGEDPTVHALEEAAAAAVGKDAALLVSSGTMGNALGVRVHCGQGDEMYADADAHVCKWEGGGPAALWGVQVRMLPALDGRPSPMTLQRRDPGRRGVRPAPRAAAARLDREHRTPTRAGASGRSTSSTTTARSRASYGLAVHMDGARLFNAADRARRVGGARRASARTPCSSASPRGSAHRSARCFAGLGRRSWPARAATASCSAAACGRPA